MRNVLKVVESNPQLSDFDLFWECYPRKKCKLDALKAWRQTEQLRPAIESLIATLDLQCKSNDWNKDGGQFIPYPASYLRRGQWDDEL